MYSPFSLSNFIHSSIVIWSITYFEKALFPILPPYQEWISCTSYLQSLHPILSCIFVPHHPACFHTCHHGRQIQSVYHYMFSTCILRAFQIIISWINESHIYPLLRFYCITEIVCVVHLIFSWGSSLLYAKICLMFSKLLLNKWVSFELNIKTLTTLKTWL